MRPTELDPCGRISEQGDFKCGRDCGCDLGLKFQHIAQISVISLRPQVKPRNSIDELRGDAHCVRRAPHTPLKYRRNVKFAGDGADVVVLSLEGKS